MYISIGDVEGASSSMPSAYQLWQNYPNPFNSRTTIRYQISKSTFVIIEILDLLGRRVRTLVSQKRPVGVHQVNWDGKDDSGQIVGSGVYLCRLQAGNFINVKRMVLLR